MSRLMSVEDVRRAATERQRPYAERRMERESCQG
jgi:hypothetical protein